MTRYFKHNNELLPEVRYSGFTAVPHPESEQAGRFFIEARRDFTPVRLKEGLPSEKAASGRLNALAKVLNETAPGGVIDLDKVLSMPQPPRRIY